MEQFSVSTGSPQAMIDITSKVAGFVRSAGLQRGVCIVFVPHTTCGVTINENADPSVPRDILMELTKTIPSSDGYTHAEGNSAAHIKATLCGSSVTVIVDGGALVLGTWQGIFLCEFDGPRNRRVIVQTIAEPA